MAEFIIRPHPSGLSMVAGMDLPAGHLLLDEDHLLTLTGVNDLTFAAKLLALSDEQHGAFWALDDVHTRGLNIASPGTEGTEPSARKTAEGIWHTNNYTYSDLEDQEREVVYPQRSRINHSCRPNCTQTFNHDTNRGEVRCVVAVSKGDEITISYLTLLTAGNRMQRQASLLETHHFVCLCEACTQSPSCQHASDLRRERMAELHGIGDFDEEGEYYTAAVPNLLEMLELLKAEGFDNNLHGIIECAMADILHETDDLEGALEWAQWSLIHSTLTHGASYSTSKDMRRYCADQTRPPVL